MVNDRKYYFCCVNLAELKSNLAKRYQMQVILHLSMTRIQQSNKQGRPGRAIKDGGPLLLLSINNHHRLREAPPGVAEKGAGALSMYRYIHNTSTQPILPLGAQAGV